MLAYLAGHHALTAAFDDVIVFTAARYAAIESVPFGFGRGNPSLKYLFPLVALLTSRLRPQLRNCLRDRLLWSCAAFALAGFLGCFPRPDIAHIGCAAPLAFPLLGWSMTRLTQWWRPTWWRYRYLVVVVAGVVIGLCAVSALFFLRISQDALRAKIVPTPRGGVAFLDSQGRTACCHASRRRHGMFTSSIHCFHAAIPDCAEQVSKYDVFMPGYTLPSQYHDACLSVMGHASWVVIDRRRT